MSKCFNFVHVTWNVHLPAFHWPTQRLAAKVDNLHDLLPSSCGLHGLWVVRVVRVQQVLRQRTHHSDPYGQAGATVWGRPLSRDHPEEEMQDQKVPDQNEGGERRWGRKKKETRQTGKRCSSRGAARLVGMISNVVIIIKLWHEGRVEMLLSTACSTGCRMQPWTSWTDCTKPCGGGIQERFMNVKKRAKGTLMASCKDRKEIRACNVHPC